MEAYYTPYLASPVARPPLARDDPGPWLSQVSGVEIRTKGSSSGNSFEHQ